MSQTLTIDNFTALNLLESTQLDADSATAVTALTVKNNQDFATLDIFMLGAYGTENSEKLSVASVATNITINTAVATKFAHKKFDAVTKLFGDKIKIYTAPNVNGLAPADSAFTTLLTTLTIDTDNQFTSYTDSSGSSALWYKYTYFNSVSSAETTLADSIAVRGGNVGNYCSIEDIRNEAGLKNNAYITDVDIDLRRRDAQAEIDTTLSGTYTVPFTAPINPLISEITRKLAAGFLLTKGFGPVTNLNTNNGTDKIKEARALLTDLNNKTKVLVNAVGSDLSVQGVAGVFNGYPNDDTATDSPTIGGGVRMFRVSDISGNGGRY